MKTKLFAAALPPLCLSLLSGCITLPSRQDDAAVSEYTLQAPQSEVDRSAQRINAPVVILVPKPELPAGFDTEKIMLQFEQGRKQDFYADAKWSGPLDELLQDMIIQLANRNLPGRAVSIADTGTRAGYRLSVKITDFQPIYANAPDTVPRLDVAMTVTLTALPDETVKNQFEVKKSAPAQANTITSITKGLETLFGAAVEQALQETARYLGTA